MFIRLTRFSIWVQIVEKSKQRTEKWLAINCAFNFFLFEFYSPIFHSTFTTYCYFISQLVRFPYFHNVNFSPYFRLSPSVLHLICLIVRISVGKSLNWIIVNGKSWKLVGVDAVIERFSHKFCLFQQGRKNSKRSPKIFFLFFSLFVLVVNSST